MHVKQDSLKAKAIMDLTYNKHNFWVTTVAKYSNNRLFKSNKFFCIDKEWVHSLLLKIFYTVSLFHISDASESKEKTDQAL